MTTKLERHARDVARAARPLHDDAADVEALLDRLGDKRFVLIGEASHGTHEFYEKRAQLTRRLITDKGFNAVAVEADWPDAYRVNRFVRVTGDTPDLTARAALSDFGRFPRWMWRNREVADFVQWLHDHNAEFGDHARAGFYGLDLYSLRRSMQAVLQYLDDVDPEAADRARKTYGCFDHFDDGAEYGQANALGLTPSCEAEATEMLRHMREAHHEDVARAGWAAEDERFYAEQNARLVKNAEAYYRSMFRGRASSWNLRDAHMLESLEALAGHLERVHGHSRIVVWAHNSHLGDARATDMGHRGELNLGQLVRERHGSDCANVGFSTYEGTVIAAHDWDEPWRRRLVRPGLAGSYEHLFHRAGVDRFLLDVNDPGPAREALEGPLLQRAIGVIYRPETERFSHYFGCRLSAQFDFVIHLDQTTALEPFDGAPAEDRPEPPETFPFGQ